MGWGAGTAQQAHTGTSLSLWQAGIHTYTHTYTHLPLAGASKPAQTASTNVLTAGMCPASQPSPVSALVTHSPRPQAGASSPPTLTSDPHLRPSPPTLTSDPRLQPSPPTHLSPPHSHHLEGYARVYDHCSMANALQPAISRLGLGCESPAAPTLARSDTNRMGNLCGSPGLACVVLDAMLRDDGCACPRLLWMSPRARCSALNRDQMTCAMARRSASNAYDPRLTSTPPLGASSPLLLPPPPPLVISCHPRKHGLLLLPSWHLRKVPPPYYPAVVARALSRRLHGRNASAAPPAKVASSWSKTTTDAACHLPERGGPRTIWPGAWGLGPATGWGLLVAGLQRAGHAPRPALHRPHTRPHTTGDTVTDGAHSPTQPHTTHRTQAQRRCRTNYARPFATTSCVM